MRMIFISAASAVVLAVQALSTAPIQAQEVPTEVTEEVRGPVTGLPLPRFVSMKASEGYARRGPSSTHRIDWVFKHRNMPLMLVDEYGQWRRVQDREGAGGWMHYSLLSGNRSVIVDTETLDLRRTPTLDARVSARLKQGVVAWLGDCESGWCALEVQGAEGWADQAALWGVEPGDRTE